MYRHGAPVNMGPPYPHDFPPPVDASYPVKYGPIPQVPPRPASFPSSTQDSYRDAGRTNVFSNPFPSGQDNNYYDAWGSLNGNSPSNPGRIVGKYNEMNWDILKRLAMNQQVEVNLSARGWVVGAVVSCLQFFKCVCRYFPEQKTLFIVPDRFPAKVITFATGHSRAKRSSNPFPPALISSNRFSNSAGLSPGDIYSVGMMSEECTG